MEKLAVVIFNLGGPTEEKEIKDFLFSLFYDKYILKFPNPFRWILAKFITVKRIKKAKGIYDKIGGGSSILSETNKQAEALYKKMIEYNCSNKEFNVFVSMRHSKPLISDTIEKLRDYNPDQIFLIPLYPQYSSTTTRSFIEEFLKVAFKNSIKSSIKYLCCYPDAHKFIDAYIKLIKIKYDQAKLLGHPKIIFSAHSLPKRIIEKGDPYQWQVEYSVQKIIDKLKIEYNLDWVISYQSRVGYSKWLTPYTEEEIIKASNQHFPIVLVPITFVSEHSETLVGLDITYKDIARQNGCIGYSRVETLRNSELFIEYLAETCVKLLNSNSGRISRICPEQLKNVYFKNKLRGIFMAEYYLWIKSFHVVAIISWMAGMLYLPRLYAYHASVKLGSELDKTFQIMENRLLRYIINPAMIITVLLGILLAYIFGFATLGIWFHLKMMLVIILLAMHGMFSKWRKDFVNGTNYHNSKFYKIINESFTMIMIAIVILVIVKPFSD